MLHRDTITLFNWHEGTGKWYTTTFPRVHLTERTGETATPQSNRTSNDSVEISIPVRPDRSVHAQIFESNLLVDNEGNRIVDAEGNFIAWSDPTTSKLMVYVKPMLYAVLSNPADAFTFKPEQDFIVLGDHWSSEPIDDPEEGLYEAFNSAQDDVYMVSSAAYYRLIPHFEISAR